MSTERLRSWGVRPVALALYLLAAATLVSFNGFSNMVFDAGWHVTLALGMVCIFLCAVVRIPFGQCLGGPGSLILAALFCYLWIGGSVAALAAGASLLPLLDNIVVLRVVLAALVIVGVALAAAATLPRIGAERLLLVILSLQAVSCVAMLMTPLLVQHVYSLSPRLAHVEVHASYRFLGTFPDPNKAGVAACLTVATALAFLACGKHVWFAGLALGLALTATFLTFSRSAMIALLALGALSVPMLASLVAKHVLAVALFVAGAGVAITVAPPLAELQLARLTIPSTEWSDIRLELLWPLALSQIAESPLVGHGITLNHAIMVTDRCTGAKSCAPHNAYLMLWREAGIVPPTLFLLFFVTMLCGGLKAPKSPARNAVVGWTVVVAVACLASDNVYATHLAFIIGVGCALLCAVWRGSGSTGR